MPNFTMLKILVLMYQTYIFKVKFIQCLSIIEEPLDIFNKDMIDVNVSFNTKFITFLPFRSLELFFDK